MEVDEWSYVPTRRREPEFGGMKKAARQTKNYSSFTVVKSTSTCIFYAMNKKKKSIVKIG